MGDNVNHPSHYTAGIIECIDAIKAATEGLEGIEAVCTANAIKYLWWWKRKNGAEDLRKAIWYINHLIEEHEGAEDGCATCRFESCNEDEEPCTSCRNNFVFGTEEYDRHPLNYEKS